MPTKTLLITGREIVNLTEDVPLVAGTSYLVSATVLASWSPRLPMARSFPPGDTRSSQVTTWRSRPRPAARSKRAAPASMATSP